MYVAFVCEDAPAMPVAEDEEDDTGDGLDWALFGRRACFPGNKRPPTSSFLLGPLSVQKKVRITQRRATQRRAPAGPATRPQEIREGDITQSENSNLTHLVKGIRSRLETHLEAAADAAVTEIDELIEEVGEDAVTDEDEAAAFARHRVAKTPDQEAAVHLFDFAINPRDFGQTVENLFYISFLVREGNAQIVKDEDGLPLLGEYTTSWTSSITLICYSTRRTARRIRATRPRRAKASGSLQYRLPNMADVHPSIRHQRVAHTASSSGAGRWWC